MLRTLHRVLFDRDEDFKLFISKSPFFLTDSELIILKNFNSLPEDWKILEPIDCKNLSKF